MDPLTPNKIQRLIHLAEDRSFTKPLNVRGLEEDMTNRLAAIQAALSKSTINYESSSGILDLDKVEAFGESAVEDESLCKSTTFNPGEMTGRSTEAARSSMPAGQASMENYFKSFDKQTDEVKQILNQSYAASDYTFQSKRDLTADEASLIRREAPIPHTVPQMAFPENELTGGSNLSVGAYFQTRCPEFGVILGKTDSPDRSAVTMPSISEVSSMTPHNPNPYAKKNQTSKMNESLDSIPVRQTKEETGKASMKPSLSRYEPKQPTNVDQTDTYNRISNVFVKPQMNATTSLMDVNYIPKNLNPVMSSTLVSHNVSHKKNAAPTPTDILLRNLQNCPSFKQAGEESEDAEEISLSISRIAEYLGKQSSVRVSEILNLQNKNQAKQHLPKKEPLTELHLNKQEIKDDLTVTNLKDVRQLDVASSSGTLKTVISAEKHNIHKGIPSLIVTHVRNDGEEGLKKVKSVRSKSPSSKSQSTMSTVQENFASFKSGDSPMQTSRGDVNSSHVRTSNVEYRELDKSVDWHDVLLQKQLKQEGLAKEQWADIESSPAKGYVGASCAVNITITTLTESWLTAKFQFDDLPNDGKDLTIELPRLPLLLSPGKTEQLNLHITSNIVLDTSLSFTIFLRDASIDTDIEQKGSVNVDIQMPVVQAMSADGVNRLSFPPMQENTAMIKTFVLISDCPEDLLLNLSIVEGDGIFSIKNAQEIKKCDVNKILMDRQGSIEDQKAKNKPMIKQLCRLSNGNAIRLSIKFNAPKLSELQIQDNIATLNGALNVNLIGVNTVLRRVDLVGVVGIANLIVKMATPKLHLNDEPQNLSVNNTGSVGGVWCVKFATNTDQNSFQAVPNKVEIRPGGTKVLTLTYTGPDDCFTETTMYLEEATTGIKTPVELTGGADKPKSFPIKTSTSVLSWIKSDRKEISLKNSYDKKVQIRCFITGEGFSIDLPGLEQRNVYLLTFGPGETRPLSIMFKPTSDAPHASELHLAHDKNKTFSKKIKLFGCAGGCPVRWCGLVTYGDTALVRAVSRQPVTLELYNKASLPVFISAKIHFNLQYAAICPSNSLSGGGRVVPGRARVSLSLGVPWRGVERRARAARAPSLATVTVLSGPELTRWRILRILKQESNGVLDMSLLPDHLKVLADHFDGEDQNIERSLANFNETKASLEDLIGGLHELTAQIVLPQDFADENTIIISDDTIVDHHTICD